MRIWKLPGHLYIGTISCLEIDKLPVSQVPYLLVGMKADQLYRPGKLLSEQLSSLPIRRGSCREYAAKRANCGLRDPRPHTAARHKPSR
jgi:hypothetical protein